MNEGKAQDLVNGAALVVAGVYFYRRLIEPSTGSDAAASSAGVGASPVEGSEPSLVSFRGPLGSYSSPGEPATVGGAAAQLFGKGKPASTERFVVGWGFVFLTLSLAVPVAPELAGAFAALTALGSILGNGQQVAKDLEAQLHHKAEKNTSTATATPTTTVAFAGQGGANAMPAVLMPEANTPKKKSNKQPRLKVQSA